MGTIAVIGSANADLIVQVDRRPDGGETILGSDLVVTAGGKGANQAGAAGLQGGVDLTPEPGPQLFFVGQRLPGPFRIAVHSNFSSGFFFRGSLT